MDPNADPTPTPEPTPQQLAWREAFRRMDAAGDAKAREFEVWLDGRPGARCQRCTYRPALPNTVFCRACHANRQRHEARRQARRRGRAG